MSSLRPLQEWICDSCGDLIDRPEDGYVIWRRDDEQGDRDFKIIHHERCDRKGYQASAALGSFLGADGLSYLMSFLSIGPLRLVQGDESDPMGSIDQFVDLVRRVQVPYYEEARLMFDDPDTQEHFGDANEATPYSTESLQLLADEAAGDDSSEPPTGHIGR